MRIVTEKEAESNLFRLADEVNARHEPVIIARADGRSVVLVALDDYDTRDDSTYLLSNPVNAARLRESVNAFRTIETPTLRLPVPPN
jgi:antitoxin YefM